MAKVKKTPVAKQVVSSEEKPSKQLEEFQGFKILPVVVDSVKNARHYFYMRKHESKAVVDEDIKDRTLFLLNLPTDTTDRHIKKLFKGHVIDQITYKDFGSSASEEYHKRTAKDDNKKNKEEEHVRELRNLFTSGSSAHVVFATEEDLTKVLNMRRVEKKWANDDPSEEPLGFERKVLQLLRLVSN